MAVRHMAGKPNRKRRGGGQLLIRGENNRTAGVRQTGCRQRSGPGVREKRNQALYFCGVPERTTQRFGLRKRLINGMEEEFSLLNGLVRHLAAGPHDGTAMKHADNGEKPDGTREKGMGNRSLKIRDEGAEGKAGASRQVYRMRSKKSGYALNFWKGRLFAFANSA